jgi:putative lipoprotein
VLLPAPEAEFARSYTQQLQILELLRAEREGFGCRLDLGDAQYRALGVEPFWRVEVSAQRLTWSSPGGDDRVFERQHAAQHGLEFTGVEASGGQLQLTLQQAVCTDPMSGSLYTLRAEVNLDGAVFSGCAVTPLPGQ